MRMHIYWYQTMNITFGDFVRNEEVQSEGFGNIILIRKKRTVIFLWRACKLLLWIV